MSSNEEEQTLYKHPHFIGKRDDVIQAGRVVASVNGRDVLVLYHQGAFYALDVRCYHSGGPLQEGGIERFAGRLCIVCPADPPTPVWCSKGVKQRVHRVTEACGDLFVTLDDSTTPIESDRYQSEKYRVIQRESRKRK